MGIDRARGDDQELSIYAGSDGSLRTEWTMWNEGKGRRWKPVMWDNDAGWTLRWDRMTEELVWYVPMTLSELPAWVAIRRNERGAPTIAIDHENVHRDIDPERVLEVLDEVLEERRRETDRNDKG